MRRKQRISVLGQEYLVFLDPVVLDDDGSELCGYMDTDCHEIHISASKCASTDVQEATLLHEVVHAVLHQSGLSRMTEEMEEALVRALEHGLHPLYTRRGRK